MKTYNITIPAYVQEIEAENEAEALEQFWFNFDTAEDDPEFMKPIITEIQGGR